jgi:transposase InsO family protein
VRLRPERASHFAAYDFVEARTLYGRKFRMVNVVDEFTRECLSIRVARKLGSADVIDVLADLFITRRAPALIRSDNGPEFIAIARVERCGVVEPGHHPGPRSGAVGLVRVVPRA